MKSNDEFRHESLQTRKTIKALLEAVTKGVGKGELTLGDDDGEITLQPDGLLTLRLRGQRSDGACRLDLRISWSEDPGPKEGKPAPRIR